MTEIIAKAAKTDASDIKHPLYAEYVKYVTYTVVELYRFRHITVHALVNVT